MAEQTTKKELLVELELESAVLEMVRNKEQEEYEEEVMNLEASINESREEYLVTARENERIRRKDDLVIERNKHYIEALIQQDVADIT
ncbi:28628_t:CDS:2 [Dentiscutata erythropus]|uniref:28628_t:CDS:1 n=1 Tax=Dentiscutata erythropus TaxID=1348616 RepID=A0A9N8V8L4_9GLOM|nr:28628_t:CDS:2 [Dentiscutata erythropus]